MYSEGEDNVVIQMEVQPLNCLLHLHPAAINAYVRISHGPENGCTK
jgi:hypothetical protein